MADGVKRKGVIGFGIFIIIGSSKVIRRALIIKAPIKIIGKSQIISETIILNTLILTFTL